ncbi:MAG: PilN domain-containing protein [Candidatus Omnitrophica bacterium]|nr:PilN domain-containing protein [Candidatus Omnitrophota bacterium]
MNKICINLNPHKEKTQGAVIQNIATYIPLAAMSAALLFVIIVLLNLFAAVRLGAYNGYQHRWKQWEGKFKEVSAIQKEIAAVEAEKKELKNIVVPKTEMSKMFAALFSSLPENIWLESIVFKKKSLTLKGYAIQWKEDQMVSLDSFIKALKKDTYFSTQFKKAVITESKQKDYQGVAVLEFIIECSN